MRDLSAGSSRFAAGLTPQGKLLYAGRLVALEDRFLLVLEADADAAEAARAHLARYAAFQKVSVAVSPAWSVASLLGPRGPDVALPREAIRLPGRGETSAQVLFPEGSRDAIERLLDAEGSIALSEGAVEILRVEAGRPRFGRDAAPGSFPQEVGLGDAIAPDKGCYVGQEIVARLRTYAKVQRRLVGFRFPEGPVATGTVFPNPDKPAQELGRVTSSVVSLRFGPIGLGLAFRGVPEGARLESPGKASPRAVVAAIPFS